MSELIEPKRLEELKGRISSGLADDKDYREIALELDEVPTPANAAVLIAMLGNSKDSKYVTLLTRYLNHREPFTVQSALVALMYDLQAHLDIADKVMELVRGVDWDEESELRQSAIVASGKILKYSDTPKLAWEIVRILESPAEDITCKALAVEAVALSMGAHPAKWSELSRLFERSGELPPEIREWISMHKERDQTP